MRPGFYVLEAGPKSEILVELDSKGEVIDARFIDYVVAYPGEFSSRWHRAVKAYDAGEYEELSADELRKLKELVDQFFIRIDVRPEGDWTKDYKDGYKIGAI